MKVTQHFRRSGVPHLVIFTRAAGELANNNGCGLLPKNWTPLLWIKHVKLDVARTLQ
jgi:hypothetical protein